MIVLRYNDDDYHALVFHIVTLSSMISIEYLRQFRIGGYAMFDFSLAFIGMALISPLLSRIFRHFNIEIPKINWVFLTLPIAIVVHLLIGQTTLMTTNFFDPQDHYLLKLLVVALLFLGLRNIKVRHHSLGSQ